MPKLHVENRFPDCVAMKLHLAPEADPSAQSALSRLMRPGNRTCQTSLCLSLTVTFSGEQEIEVPGGKRLGLPGGRASFGVRRGQLRFALNNCVMPLDKTALSKPFQVSREVATQTTRSREVQATATLDARSVGAKAAQGSTETTTETVFQVKKIGSEEQPAWVFEAYGDGTVLEGELKKALLGVLDITEPPYKIRADFTVRGEDVQITWGKIGQVQNIHRNKLALIERAIALRYIKPLVEASPLCEGRGHYG